MDTHASAWVSSLRDIPTGKNLKRLSGQQQHRRLTHQASPVRLIPPSARFLLGRLYFLHPQRYNYLCLGFFPGRLSGVLRAGRREASATGLASISPNLTGRSLSQTASIWPGASGTGATRCRSGYTFVEKCARIVLDRTTVTIKLPELE